MTLEQRGIPTVLMCPETFRGMVEAQASLSGMPSYKPVTLPGRIVAISGDELLSKVDEAADEMIQGLVAT